MTEQAATLSADEAAVRLGLGSPWGIYEGVRRGEIPNAGVGKRVRVPVRWINERLGEGSDAGGINGRFEPAVAPELLARALRAAADVLDPQIPNRACSPA